MQTAKFSLTLNPTNIQYVRGITPPELVILHALHFKESNGSPIGDDLQLESGEALTVEVPEKAGESEYFHAGSGKIVPEKPFVAAVAHARTDAEEAERLKKKYSAKPPHVKDAKPVFEHCFGTSLLIKFPQTFEEVLPALGLRSILPADLVTVANPVADDLEKKSRSDLVAMALSLKLPVAQRDSKEAIIDAIVAAQKPV